MSDHLNKHFVQQELRLAIFHLKKEYGNSLTGYDRIAYEFFHQMPTSGRDIILKLYNAIWSKGQLPKAWKHATILPILQVGKDPGHVVPTDIAHVDDEQADGKTGHKPTNVVL